MSGPLTDTANKLADLLERLAKELRDQSKPLPSADYWKLYEPAIARPMCEACKKGGVCGCYQPEWDSPK